MTENSSIPKANYDIVWNCKIAHSRHVLHLTNRTIETAIVYKIASLLCCLINFYKIPNTGRRYPNPCPCAHVYMYMI